MTPEHIAITITASVLAFAAGLLVRPSPSSAPPRRVTPTRQEAPAESIYLPDPKPLSPEQRTFPFQGRYPPNWNELRKLVYRRDRHTCQNCNATQTRVNAHHVVPVRAEGRHHLRNLTTLCDRCHALADGYA